MSSWGEGLRHWHCQTVPRRTEGKHGHERDGQWSSGTVDSLKVGLCSRTPAGYLGSNPKSASSKSPALVSTSVNGVHSNIHRTEWPEAQWKFTEKTREVTL